MSQLDYDASVSLTCTFTESDLTLQYYFKPPGADYVLENSATKELQMSSAHIGDHQCKVGTSTEGIMIEAPESNILELAMKESKFYRNK